MRHPRLARAVTALAAAVTALTTWAAAGHGAETLCTDVSANCFVNGADPHPQHRVVTLSGGRHTYGTVQVVCGGKITVKRYDNVLAHKDGAGADELGTWRSSRRRRSSCRGR